MNTERYCGAMNRARRGAARLFCVVSAGVMLTACIAPEDPEPIDLTAALAEAEADGPLLVPAGIPDDAFVSWASQVEEDGVTRFAMQINRSPSGLAQWCVVPQEHAETCAGGVSSGASPVRSPPRAPSGRASPPPTGVASTGWQKTRRGWGATDRPQPRPARSSSASSSRGPGHLGEGVARRRHAQADAVGLAEVGDDALLPELGDHLARSRMAVSSKRGSVRPCPPGR